MVGNALQATGNPGDTLYGMGKGITDYMDEAKQNNPVLQPSQESQEGFVRPLVTSIARMPGELAPLIVGAALTAAALPEAAVAGLGAIGTGLVTYAASAVPYAMAKFNEKYNANKAAGLSNEDAHSSALNSAGIDWAMLTAMPGVDKAVTGVVGKMLEKPIADMSAETITSLLKTPMQRNAPSLIGAVAGMTGVGAAASAAEAQNDLAYGTGTQTPMDAVMHDLPQSLAMSLIFGLAGRIMEPNEAGKMKALLTNGDANPDARMIAVQQINKVIRTSGDTDAQKRENIKLADTWAQQATQFVEAGKAIPIEDKISTITGAANEAKTSVPKPGDITDASSSDEIAAAIAAGETPAASATVASPTVEDMQQQLKDLNNEIAAGIDKEKPTQEDTDALVAKTDQANALRAKIKEAQTAATSTGPAPEPPATPEVAPEPAQAATETSIPTEESARAKDSAEVDAQLAVVRAQREAQYAQTDAERKSASDALQKANDDLQSARAATRANETPPAPPTPTEEPVPAVDRAARVAFEQKKAAEVEPETVNGEPKIDPALVHTVDKNRDIVLNSINLDQFIKAARDGHITPEQLAEHVRKGLEAGTMNADQMEHWTKGGAMEAYTEIPKAKRTSEFSQHILDIERAVGKVITDFKAERPTELKTSQPFTMKEQLEKAKADARAKVEAANKQAAEVRRQTLTPEEHDAYKGDIHSLRASVDKMESRLSDTQQKLSTAETDGISKLGIKRLERSADKDSRNLEAAKKQIAAIQEQSGLLSANPEPGPNGTGMKAEDVKQRINDLGFEHGPGSPIRVVQSRAELPPHLEEMAQSREETTGKKLTINGVYSRRNGRVYVVADSMNPEQVERTLKHELVHRGEEPTYLKLFGEKGMADVRAQIKGQHINEIDAIMGKFPGMDVGTAFREYLAQRGEGISPAEATGFKATLDKALFWMRNQLRKMGFKLDFSDGDLIHLLRRMVSEGAEGKFDKARYEAGFSTSPKTFYSKLQNVLATKLPENVTRGALKDVINGNIVDKVGISGIKPEEIKDSGVMAIFGDRKAIPKKEILDYLNAASRTEVKDVRLGISPADAEWETFNKNMIKKYGAGYGNRQMSVGEIMKDTELRKQAAEQRESATLYPTKFSQYTEPGAIPGSYREKFVTAPAGEPKRPEGVAIHKIDGRYIAFDKDDRQITSADTLDRLKREIDKTTPRWFDGHPQYDTIDNPIVRIRYNDRLDAQGNATRFIEELQGPSKQNEAKMPEIYKKYGKQIGLKSILADIAKENDTPSRRAFAEVTKPENVRELVENFGGREFAASSSLSVVQAHMLPLLEHDQIRRAVVEAIPVDVMKTLSLHGFNAKDLTRNAPMVFKSLPIDARAKVSRGLGFALENVGAKLRAALDRTLSDQATGRDIELLPTLSARDIDAREVSRLLAPSRLTDLSAEVGRGGGTGSRAVSTTALPHEAGMNHELGATKLADALNLHAAIVQGSPSEVNKRFEAPTSSLSWTSGDMQAERYDLSKHIDDLEAWKHDDGTYSLRATKGKKVVISESSIAEGKLEAMVGKDLAQKIINEEGMKPSSTYTQRANGELGSMKYSGLDLKVGGEGLKRLYDETIPKFLDKYGEQWGAKVEKPAATDRLTYDQITQALNDHEKYPIDSPQRAVLRKEQETAPDTEHEVLGSVSRLPVTPAMESSIRGEGQALFSAERKEPEPGENPNRTRDTIAAGARAGLISKEGAQHVEENVDATHRVKTNTETVADARDFIAKQGWEKAESHALDDSAPSARKSAISMLLIQKLDSEGSIDRSTAITAHLTDQLVQGGQASQALAMWAISDPRVFLRQINNTIKGISTREDKGLGTVVGIKNKIPKALNPAQEAEVIQTFNEIRKLPDGPDKSSRTGQLIDRIAGWIPPGTSEWIDAYRYSNMLSGWQSWERMLEHGATNALFTTPILKMMPEAAIDYVKATFQGTQRTAYMRDVPTYYKALFNAHGHGVSAFMDAWRGKKPNVQQMRETGIDVRTDFLAKREANLPAALKVIGRLYDAAHMYQRTLMQEADYAVQRQRGMTHETATEHSKVLASTMMYQQSFNTSGDPRTQEGRNYRDLSAIGKSLAGVQGLILNLRGSNSKILSISTKLLAPFIRVPTNLGIQLVEYSPLGLLRSRDSFTNENVAKVVGGSALVALGTSLAMNGQTTWTAPADKKDRELFYATGRKPFSMQIGDKWVPVWWLGPGAMAFLMPTAVKYYAQDQTDALKKDGMEKAIDIMLGTAHFIGSQSSVQSLGAMFDLMSGKDDFTVAKMAATTAEQFIPASGALRNVAKMLDPVFRKPESIMEHIEATLPLLSENVPAQKQPHGEPAPRIPWNAFVPFEMGQENPSYEAQYKATAEAQKLLALNRDFRTQAKRNGSVTPAAYQDYLDKLNSRFQ
jgi:hypothetical protein